jgi:butyryl-CoA dehydrogenase
VEFKLTREQEMVRKMVRSFSENEVKPLAAEVDETERFPMETVKKMARYHMMGTFVPREYGGAGADEVAYAITV